MGLHEEMEERFHTALKEKDELVLDVVRMIRSRAKKIAIDKSRELDDELYLETIGGYVKQMKRAVVEYEAAGDRGEEMAKKLRFEVEYLEPLLPSMMGEDEARSLVKSVIEEQSISDPRQAGRIVGMIMKNHRGQVDPAMVKRIADEELNS